MATGGLSPPASPQRGAVLKNILSQGSLKRDKASPRRRMAISQAGIKTLPNYKLIVLGDRGVGKSTIALQVFHKVLVPVKDSTINNSFIQDTEVDREWAKIEVLDVGGLGEISAMRELCISRGDGFLLVYSVTDAQSYENIINFHKMILRNKDRDVYPMLLVANKVDLVQLRRISEEQGRELADRLGIPYIETSAKDPPQNIDKAIHWVLNIIRKESPQDNKRKKRCTIT